MLSSGSHVVLFVCTPQRATPHATHLSRAPRLLASPRPLACRGPHAAHTRRCALVARGVHAICSRRGRTLPFCFHWMWNSRPPLESTRIPTILSTSATSSPTSLPFCAPRGAAARGFTRALTVNAAPLSNNANRRHGAPATLSTRAPPPRPRPTLSPAASLAAVATHLMCGCARACGARAP
eukprot:1557834-Prymnesium_polylepis.1